MNPHRSVGRVLTALGLLALAAVYIVPLFHMFSTSLKSFSEAVAFPPALLPQRPHFENYAEAMKSIGFLHHFRNSLVVTLLTILGQILVCVPCAYAFAKKDFKGKKFLFGFILFDLMVPAQIVFLPLYVTVSNLGWLNTYQGLVVPFAYSAFTIFFLTQSFKTIPDELIDAAKMDRSTEAQIIFRLMVPAVRSVIITVGLFTFISKWNDYFWATILTTDDSVRTMPLAVKGLLDIGDGITHWDVAMAGNVILLAPMLLIYLFASKSIKKAFSYGGVK